MTRSPRWPSASRSGRHPSSSGVSGYAPLVGDTADAVTFFVDSMAGKTQPVVRDTTRHETIADLASEPQEPFLPRLEIRAVVQPTNGRAAASNSASAPAPRDRPRLRWPTQPFVQPRDLRFASAAASGSKPGQAPLPPQAHTPSPFAAERRRLERDLHDGVQNELVALIAQLALAQQRAEITPAVANVLAGLEGRAQAALDSVRAVARGIYPALLADFGLRETLRAQARRATVNAIVLGSASRGGEEAEEAVYFACSEALQNAAKHAGDDVEVTIRLHQNDEKLVVSVTDHGRGFDPAHTVEGAGLRNIRARLQDLGGTFTIASRPGCGTGLILSLPWPPRAERDR